MQICPVHNAEEIRNRIRKSSVLAPRYTSHARRLHKNFEGLALSWRRLTGMGTGTGGPSVQDLPDNDEAALLHAVPAVHIPLLQGVSNALFSREQPTVLLC